MINKINNLIPLGKRLFTVIYFKKTGNAIVNYVTINPITIGKLTYIINCYCILNILILYSK